MLQSFCCQPPVLGQLFSASLSLFTNAVVFFGGVFKSLFGAPSSEHLTLSPKLSPLTSQPETSTPRNLHPPTLTPYLSAPILHPLFLTPKLSTRRLSFPNSHTPKSHPISTHPQALTASPSTLKSQPLNLTPKFAFNPKLSPPNSHPVTLNSKLSHPNSHPYL